jgi:hypothetical protein
MNLLKCFSASKSLAIALSPAVVLVSILMPQLPTYSVEFPPTNDRGAVTRTSGGGTRGNSCGQVSAKALTALVPGNHLGKTVAANPTLFWYVPKTTARTAEFFVMDDAGNEIYQKTVSLPATAGVIKLDFPKSISLEINKTYQWEFGIICDSQDRTKDQLVMGTIQRTELSPELKAELEQAEPLAQAEVYAKAKIWQDTLTIAAELRRSNPDAWEELLKSVGLEAIANEPFVECCTVEN